MKYFQDSINPDTAHVLIVFTAAVDIDMNKLPQNVSVNFSNVNELLQVCKVQDI
jgi:hypothetical protein